MIPAEFCKLNLTEWGHTFRGEKIRRHTPFFIFPSKNIAILNQSRWFFAYSCAPNISSCQNHLSLKNIHRRSQALVSVAHKVGSNTISETLLISAVQLLIFQKNKYLPFADLLPVCHSLFWTWNYSCKFCRLGLSGFIEEYIQHPK